MLVLNDICQYEGKYAALSMKICHFLELSLSAVFGKKFQSTGTYTK